MNFDGMMWEPPGLRWHGLTFTLDPRADGATELVLWKSPALVAQYEAFWAREPGFTADHVFELGVWKGGSLAFWAEALMPKRLVGIDLAPASPSAAFDRYAAARADHLRVRWGTDQSDRRQVREILDTDFDGPIDLAIDDASHLYGPTRTSFETIFPHLRPGGLYILEDWAWAHWIEFQPPTSPFAGQIPLTRLVSELVAIAGTADIVRRLTVQQGFVAVERGAGPLPDPFTVETAASWGPCPPPQSLRRLLRDLRAEVSARVRAGLNIR